MRRNAHRPYGVRGTSWRWNLLEREACAVTHQACGRVRAAANDKPRALRGSTDTELPHHSPRGALAGGRHVFLDVGAAGRILEHHTVACLADGFEPSEVFGKGAASDFFRARRGFTGIGERYHFARLPSRIDSVGEPYRAVRFGQRRLTARRFLVRMMVGPRRERNRSDALSSPDCRHANQIDVEGCPDVAGDPDHQRPWREIVGRKSRPGPPCIND